MSEVEVWRVVFWWRSGASLYESSCDAALAAGVTALEAILTVARWRGVDLALCYEVSAKRLTPKP